MGSIVGCDVSRLTLIVGLLSMFLMFIAPHFHFVCLDKIGLILLRRKQRIGCCDLINQTAAPTI
jgi:hypothetical protein